MAGFDVPRASTTEISKRCNVSINRHPVINFEPCARYPVSGIKLANLLPRVGARERVGETRRRSHVNRISRGEFLKSSQPIKNTFRSLELQKRNERVESRCPFFSSEQFLCDNATTVYIVARDSSRSFIKMYPEST